MQDQNNNTKRIAKNTIFLYFRMILVLVVTLYTSRIVLDALGVDDFGIYNVVGGVASMLTFFTSALTNASQRFLNFEIGKGNRNVTNNVFNLTITLYALLCVFLLIALETIGLWLVNSQLTIPHDRIIAANWVFQCSVILCIMTVLQVPFLSMIIAKEKMNVYAIVGIVDAIAKLVIAYLLNLFPDKLIAYSILFVIEWIVINIIYITYCRLSFEESRFYFYWEKIKAKELINFISQTAFGCLSWSVAYQGGSILLNHFFSPAVNAARGIAMQVNDGIGKFTNGVITAVKPQIIQSYANGNTEYLKKLFFASSKYSVILMLILSFPVLFNIDIILSVWLKDVPYYTNWFTILIVVDSLIATICQPITIVLNATGQIKVLQIFGRVITLFSLPVSYIVLKFNIFSSPLVIFISLIFAELGYWMICYWDMNRKLNWGIGIYLRKIVTPLSMVILISVISTYLCTSTSLEGLFKFSLVSFVSVISVLLSSYIFVITEEEKEHLMKFSKKLVK